MSLDIIIDELERAERHLVLGLTFDAMYAVRRAKQRAEELRSQNK
uniref:Uncharacterized protein n=1 Tax=viral metagenome TaxID=1070528 RepID=A0A6M3LEW8_9ZZZZ